MLSYIFMHDLTYGYATFYDHAHEKEVLNIRHKWKNILHVSEKVLNSKMRIQFNIRENNLSKFKLI